MLDGALLHPPGQRALSQALRVEGAVSSGVVEATSDASGGTQRWPFSAGLNGASVVDLGQTGRLRGAADMEMAGGLGQGKGSAFERSWTLGKTPRLAVFFSVSALSAAVPKGRSSHVRPAHALAASLCSGGLSAGGGQY